MSPTTSVVVCAYTEQRWDLLRAAVASVAAQTVPALETILVIDHNDALLARCRAELGPAVRVLPNGGTRGLSGARNTGVAAANGEVIAFLDDDAAAEPGWLAALLAGYADRSVMGVGGRATPVWPGVGARPAWWPPEFDWVVGCTYVGTPLVGADVRNFLGANMSFRREAFEQAGGFDDAVGRVGTRPVGCEETEFCIRLSQTTPGTRLRYEPDAVVRHHVSADRTSWSYFRRRCYSEGLSKAVISRMVGQSDSLETERGYVTRVLPRAVVAALSDSVRSGRPHRLLPGGAVVLGLLFTTWGYALTRWTGRRTAQQAG